MERSLIVIRYFLFVPVAMILSGLLLLCGNDALAGGVTKCVDENGNVTFSDTGCTASASDVSSVDVELDYEPSRAPPATSSQDSTRSRSTPQSSRTSASEPRTMSREQYYSPAEQWKRVQQMNEREETIRHNERIRKLNEANAEKNLRSQPKTSGLVPNRAKKSAAECDSYRAEADLWENKARRGASTRDERLKYESHWKFYEKLISKNCR